METPTRTVASHSILIKGFRNELELLSRHIHMLEFVEKHGPIGIIRLSKLLGVPKHKVRYSFRILEKEGYIRPSTDGAVGTDRTHQFLEQMNTLLVGVKKEVDELLVSLRKSL